MSAHDYSIAEIVKNIVSKHPEISVGAAQDIGGAILSERSRCAEKAWSAAEEAHCAGYQGSNADRIYNAVMGVSWIKSS